MKEFNELIFDQDIKYSVEHTWAREEGNVITSGISDYAQDQLGEIIFVELPQVGDTFSAGDVFGIVESAKTTSDLHMPIGGEIVEINSELEDAPEIVNDNPYTTGWMIKIQPSDAAEIQQLLLPEAYADSVKKG